MSVTDPLAAPDRIAFIGDVHGDFGFAARALTYAAERCADVAIQCGDFGFRRLDEAFVGGVSAVACRLGVPVLWVDGNHENHPGLAAVPVDPVTGLRPIAPGIWHLPRGFRWTWAGVRFLALGGAYSVDRTGRIPGLDWFPEECLSHSEVIDAAVSGPADVMICHDAPAGAAIPDEAFEAPGVWSPRDVRASDQHREGLRYVTDHVRPRWLFHGHYHVRYVDELVGEGYRCTVRGLAANKAATLSHAVFVQPLRMLTPTAERPAPTAVAGRGRHTR